MARPPAWATDLVTQVCRDEGVAPPALIWRRWRSRPARTVQMRPGSYDPAYHPTGVLKLPGLARPRFSGGTTYYENGGRIVMTVGTARVDQKLVLLHELAHCVTRHGHDDVFWRKTWELFRRHRIPIRYAIRREGNYRRGALVAYRAIRAAHPRAPRSSASRERPVYVHARTCGQCCALPGSGCTRPGSSPAPMEPGSARAAMNPAVRTCRGWDSAGWLRGLDEDLRRVYCGRIQGAGDTREGDGDDHHGAIRG